MANCSAVQWFLFLEDWTLFSGKLVEKEEPPARGSWSVGSLLRPGSGSRRVWSLLCSWVWLQKAHIEKVWLVSPELVLPEVFHSEYNLGGPSGLLCLVPGCCSFEGCRSSMEGGVPGASRSLGLRRVSS